MLQQKIIGLIKNKHNLNLFIYGLGQGFNLITPLLVIPYIISVCGVENYGKVGIGMAVCYFLMVFVDYGSDIIGVKEVAVNRDNPEALAKIFTTAYQAKLVLLCAVLLVSSVVFVVVPYFSREAMLFFLSLPILAGQYLNPIWFLQGVDRFRMITVLNVLSKVIYLVGVFTFIREPDDYIFVNLWWGIGMILPFFGGLLICKTDYAISFSNPDKQAIRHFIVADFKFCFSQLFLSLKNYAPIMVVSFLGNFTIAGHYKVIEQIIMPFRSYLQMFFRFFYPKLCYEIYGDKNRGFHYWKKIGLGNGAFVLLLVSVIFVFNVQVLQFFHIDPELEPDMLESLNLALLLPLFITGSYSLEQLMLSLGKKEIYIRITIAAVILNFFLMFGLFAAFALNGLISALIVTETGLIVLNSALITKYFKTEPAR